MRVSRLWRRGLTRSWSQKSRFVSHEETTHSVFSSISSQFLAGKNLGFGRTRHGYLLSTPLLREGFFAERESGSCRIIPVWACLRSADNRRCICTSEAPIVEGNVGSFCLQQNNGISNWEEQIHKVSGGDIPMCKAAHSATTRFLLCNGAIADGIDDPSFPHQNMGGEDAQNPSPFQSDNVMGECRSFERLENSDSEDGAESAWLALSMAIKDTPQENGIVNAICKLLNSKGWTESTEGILENQYYFQLTPAVISTVIAQQKNVALTSYLFQWACKHMGHNIRIYHAYLVMLGETKHFDEMWDLLTKLTENGLEASGRTFCMMIRACGVAGVPEMAVDVFKRARENGIVSIHLHRALLTMFFESNLVEEARLFYSFMIQEGLIFDTQMFNTLIDGFNLFSATEDAKSSFNTLLKEGCEPNILTYNGLIEAYCNVNAIEKAMAAFSDLQRMGLKPTASTVNLLLSAYCKMGRLDDAINLFASMNDFCTTPNRSTFNILLHGLFSVKKVSQAIMFFLSMEKEGLTNRLTYIYLSSGLRAAQQTEKVWQLCKDLFATHGYGIKEVCAALLNNLSCTGELNEAESLFEGLLESSREPYTPSFAIMISLYCRLEMPDRAFAVLSDLKGRGGRPSVFCYTPIIAALLKTNRVSDALKCFQEMVEQKCEVTAITCDFLLRELCKHGMIEDALHVLNTILSKKLRIRRPTLTELMKCLCKVGKVEEANSCFRALYQLQCLPLKRDAALQALSVMDVMSHSSNEEDRISTCVSV